MTPRDIVLEQIHHRPTNPVPYTLGFEGDVDHLEGRIGFERRHPGDRAIAGHPNLVDQGAGSDVPHPDESIQP